MLIPLYGLYGAALATAVAMIFEAAALYSVAFRRLGLKLVVFSGLSNGGGSASDKARRP